MLIKIIAAVMAGNISLGDTANVDMGRDDALSVKIRCLSLIEEQLGGALLRLVDYGSITKGKEGGMTFSQLWRVRADDGVVELRCTCRDVDDSNPTLSLRRLSLRGHTGTSRDDGR